LDNQGKNHNLYICIKSITIKSNVPVIGKPSKMKEFSFTDGRKDGEGSIISDLKK